MGELMGLILNHYQSKLQHHEYLTSRRYKKVTAPLVFFFLSLLTWPSFSEDGQTLQSYVGDQRENKHFTLDNGMDVVIISDQKEEHASISISIPVGGFYEDPGFGGIAKLHQKLLLKQSKNFARAEAIERFIEDHNGTNFSETKGSLTTFAFTVDNALVGNLLNRVADSFNDPVFQLNDCEENIKGLHSEWYSQKKQAKALQSFLLAELSDNPQIGHFTTGNMKTLKASDVIIDALNKYHQQFLMTDKMKVVIITSRPIEDVEKKVTEQLTKIKPANGSIPDALSQLSLKTMGNRYVSINSKKNQLIVDLPIDSAGKFLSNKFYYIAKQILSSDQRNSFTRWLDENKYVSSFNVSFIRWPMQKGFIEITMELTKTGLENKSKILSGLKELIDLMKNIEDLNVYHHEMQDILMLESFIYKPGKGVAYAKELAVNAQYLPIEYLLKADHIITDFNEKEMRDILSELSFENAIVFDLSVNPDAKTTNDYFSTAYNIKGLDDVLAKESESLNLSLHEVNKYIPSSFDLNSAGKFTEPELMAVEDRVETAYMSSYNPYYPIGSTILYFNLPTILETPLERHLARIYVYILNVRTETLRDHAAAAVNEVNFNEESGLKITINGIPQKQGLIIGDILYKLLQPITAEELNKAVAFYSDRTKRQNAKSGDTLMHIRFDMIKNNYLFSEKALLKDLKKMNEESFNQFVDKLLAVDKIRILTYGSYSKEEIEAISALLNEFAKKLPKPVQRDYVTRFDNRLENNKIYQLNERRPNSDEQAFLNAYIDSKPGIEAKASMIVYVMLVNASEKKIKSLGIQDHNIALAYRELGEYPAIVFSTQSKGSLQNMNESLNQYIKETYTTFERMNKYSFEEAKEDLIKQVDQTIKNLESDLNYHVSNWLHRTPEENNRIAVINTIEKVTLDDVKDLYKRLIKDEKGTRVIIQLQGEKSTNKDKRFKMFKDSIIIKPL